MKSKLKSVAVILNSNQIGGAERSLLEQLSMLQDQYLFTFFIPQIHSDDSALKRMLNAKGFHTIQYFKYPKFLYGFSRSHLYKFYLLPFMLPFLFVDALGWYRQFNSFSIFYINGNKASFPLLFVAFLFRSKKNIFWHFRDFPETKLFSLIEKCMRLLSFFTKSLDFKLIANSHAVADKLKVHFPSYPISCLYNLPGQFPTKRKNEKIVNVGVVAMHAPWKGLHTVLLMIALNEEKLKQLGIKKFLFYGENIYKTDGEHKDYSKQLADLAQKLGVTMVEWSGNRPPEEIFSKIDLLIHPSIRPEPFGRVVAEAFKTHTAVITSGLGGTKELVGESNYALEYAPFDYQGLYEQIESFANNEELRSRITELAYQKIMILETEIKAQIVGLLE